MAKFAIENNSMGVLIAFWDGKSKGTKHMIEQAAKYDLKVYVAANLKVKCLKVKMRNLYKKLCKFI